MDKSPVCNVPLEKVLRPVLPLNTKVVSGPPTGREVRWTSVLTGHSHIQDQVRAGDIVILPAGLQEQADEERLVEAVEKIVGHAAAVSACID